ncbi:MAG: hypothetical protein EBX41_08085 [Chitinophagia bacterium]|nr:hypothetical protein [Chitinophagia bacterium]
MSDIINTIKKVLNAIYKPEKQNLLFEEDFDNNGKPFKYSISLYSDNEIDYVLYRFEDNSTNSSLPILFPYFSDFGVLNKMCDYILFAVKKTQKKPQLYIFCIELKKSNASGANASANQQLEAGKVFVDYIIKSIRRLAKSGKDVSVCETDDIHIKTIHYTHSKLKNNTKMPKDLEFDANGHLDYNYKAIYLQNII